MPTITATVDVTNNFPQMKRAYSDLARRAVGEAAKVGGAKAASIAAQRSKSGTMARIAVSSPTGSVNGWESAFLSPIYYAWFQNWGTLGNRTRPLKQPGRSTRSRAPGTGIKPLYFLDSGKREGRRAMMAMIRKGV
jgi:hypothetical protein